MAPVETISVLIVWGEKECYLLVDGLKQKFCLWLSVDFCQLLTHRRCLSGPGISLETGFEVLDLILDKVMEQSN